MRVRKRWAVCGTPQGWIVNEQDEGPLEYLTRCSDDLGKTCDGARAGT